MEMIDGSFGRYWRRRKYQRIDNDAHRKSLKTVRFGGTKKTRSYWRIRAIPRLRLKMVVYAPLRLWVKFKNAYVNMMLRVADSPNPFGGKRIPKDRQVVSSGHRTYSNDEFHNRLVYEIYKSMMDSRPLPV